MKMIVNFNSICLISAAWLSICACGSSEKAELDGGLEEIAPVSGLFPLEDENPDPSIVEYTLSINQAELELLPGAGVTPVYAYNDRIPGPLLQARVGDTVRITAINNLDEPTTIHWHGLRIDYRMDGVVHGSVPAIEPGETFVYEFIPPDAGTYWYHPHMRTNVQVERGLYGMLVVYEADGSRPEMDADRAFILDDIRLNEDGSIAPFTNSTPDIIHGRAGNTLLLNGSTEPLPLSLAEGAVERWRVVNTSNAREMLLRFPGLEVREIGADGGLWPQSMTRTIKEISVPIGARAELEVRLLPGASSARMDNMVLILNEAGEVVLEPFLMVEVSTDGSVPPKAGHIDNPMYESIPTNYTSTKRLALSVANVGGQLEMQINGVAFKDAEVWEVKRGELQVIEISNLMPMNGHPFHLHGQFFQILTRNGAATSEPGWRDTVMIPAGGTEKVTIATYFDNPGMWMYHCHILEHAEAGMMAMVEVVD